MKTPVTMALACALAAFYVVIGYLAMHPTVSEAYQDYYISRQTALAPEARRNLPTVIPGRVYPHTSKHLGFVGWHEAEERFRWSDGHEAKIVFRMSRDSPAGRPGGACLQLVALGRQRVEWRVNRGAEGRFVVEDGGCVCLDFGADDIVPGENVLRLSLPDAHRPGPKDGRTLAIAVEAVTFR